MKASLFALSVRFVLILMIQIFFFKDIAIAGTTSGFIYVWFLLTLPIDLAPMTGLFLGFFSGLAVDFFMQTPGIHAGASTLLMALRPSLLKALTPRGGYDPNQQPTFFFFGWPWYLILSISLILVHHLLAFSLEIFSMEFSGLIAIKTLTSTLFTWVCVTTVILLTGMPRR